MSNRCFRGVWCRQRKLLTGHVSWACSEAFNRWFDRTWKFTHNIVRFLRALTTVHTPVHICEQFILFPSANLDRNRLLLEWLLVICDLHLNVLALITDLTRWDFRTRRQWWLLFHLAELGGDRSLWRRIAINNWALNIISNRHLLVCARCVLVVVVRLGEINLLCDVDVRAAQVICCLFHW